MSWLASLIRYMDSRLRGNDDIGCGNDGYMDSGYKHAGMTRRDSGYVLLPVMIALTFIAAIAFMISRETGMENNMVANELQAARAQYVAQAGLEHALRQIRLQGCGPYTDLNKVSFGNDEYDTKLITSLGDTTPYVGIVDQDGWIRNDNTDTAHPTDTKLHIRYELGNIERPTFRYDLSSIPAGSTILSATAKFHVNKEFPQGPVDIHLLTKDWAEADADWDLLGEEIGKQVIATIPAQPAADVWVEVNLTAQVQAWINGQSNFGITFNSNAEGTHAEFSSKESFNEPVLEVVVGTPAKDKTILKSKGKLASGAGYNILRDQVLLTQNPGSYTYQQPDASDATDTYIYQWKPTWNYGVDTTVFVSNYYYDSFAVGLMKFNLGSLPHGAQVEKATLRLYQYSNATNGGTVGIHRVKRDWEEGEKSGGNGAGANWTVANSTQNWSSPGGDYDSQPVALQTLVAGEQGYYDWDITPLVNGWASGEISNQGLALVPQSPFTDVYFRSSDYSVIEQRPIIEITYRCACGDPCMALQGSGKILLVVVNPTSLEPPDAYKKALFESWGYEVSVLSESANQTDYDNAVADNDVVFISETVNSNKVGTSLVNAPIGVVSQDGDYNADLGFSAGNSWKVASTINIADNSHYITQPFASGDLQIYESAMEQLIADGTKSVDLQTLADTDGGDSLVVLEKGAALTGGGNAAGRRVMLPLGRDSDFNYRFDWEHLNHKGRLLVQRALQWGAGSGSACESGDYSDLFSTIAWDGSDGSFDWAPNPWQELVETDGAGSGLVRVLASSYCVADNCLRIGGTEANINGKGISRVFDLSNAITAELNFSYRRQRIEDGGGTVILAVSSDGGSNWTDLSSYTMNSTDAEQVSQTFDLAAFIGEDIRIRFIGSGTAQGNFFADDISITTSCSIEPPLKPIAHWKLDETSGNTAVDSEGGHDGTVTTPQWFPGQLDGGLLVEGIDANTVSVPHSDELTITDKLTVSAWIFKDQYFGYDAAISKASVAADQNYFFGTWEDEIVFGFATATDNWQGYYSSAANLATKTWYHIAATFDNPNDTVKLYLDGVLIDTFASTLDPMTNTGNVRLGRSAMGEYWRGLLDDVRLYNEVLTDAEVAELATVPTIPPAGKLLLVVVNPTGLTVQEDAKKTLFESWGYTVSLIDESDNQATYDVALSANDVVYVTEDVTASNINTKLVNASIGVVTEEVNLSDELGFSSTVGWDSGTQIDITDNSHYITSEFSTGLLTIMTTSESLAYASGTLAPDLDELASSTNGFGVIALNASADAIDGRTTAGRRVMLPWGGNNMDVNYLNADGQTLLKRAIEWGSGLGDDGAGGGGTPPGPGGDPCSVSATYRDNFDALAMDGSNGSLDWSSSPWIEVGESDGFATGDVLISSDLSNNRLRIRDNNNGGEGGKREADLTGATTATLSLNYRRNLLDSAGDYVSVHVTSDGINAAESSWVELDQIGTDNDSTYQSYSRDISAYISATTAIRLRSSSSMGNNDIVYFDNVEISCAP